MITRIKIDGFKSLLDTELYFGPFTCIAGANAVGKSNFFDALLFLSKLADGKSLLEAAKSIRSESEKHSEIKEIFFKSGENFYDKMSFEVDMLVPLHAEDDLGQEAEASITSLRYILELKLNLNNEEKEPIEISKEELKPITQRLIKKNLFFDKSKEWVNSVVLGRRPQDLISTDGLKIRLHQDGSKGRTTEFIAEKMPRTLLSTVTAESPTAFLVRHEMRNWVMLQFEPSALRKPNTTYEVRNAEITANGSNMPATLYRLHTEKKEEDVYQILTNKLKNLVSDIDEIKVDKDEKRDLLTLQVKFKDGLILPAQSLSDGTLRFLGLAIIKEDSKSSGLICLEEPENGINPKKVEEMVKLLEEMAVDTDFEIDDDNPLRQVIINSHSPLVVSNVPDECFYLAIEKEKYSEKLNRKIKFTSFSAPKDTWKTKNKLVDETSLGEMMAYLDNSNNFSKDNKMDLASESLESYKTKTKRTVAENINQMYLFEK